MRQITKDFLETAVLASPSHNDLVSELVIHQRFGGSVPAGSVVRVKGGLHVRSADDPHQIHLIDEENISGLSVILNEDEASKADVHDIPQLIRWAAKQDRFAA